MLYVRKYLLYFLVFIFSFTYGAYVVKFQIFPYSIYARVRSYYNPVSYKPYSKIQIDSFTRIFSKRLVVKPSNVDSLRSAIKKIVFGLSTLPSYFPASISKVIDSAYLDLAELGKIEEFRVDLPLGFNSIGYIFYPGKSNNRLVLYYQGHDGDFIFGKSTISYFLRKGYTVYAFSLPLLGKNNQPAVHTKDYGTIQFGSSHDVFKFLPNPLSYFIAPVIVMINHAEKTSFKSISMIGISGGAWATTLAAALDTRINFSFPVAGTYPFIIRFIRPESNYGDFEQLYPPLMQSVDYLDLYLLGSVGKSRSQTQILNLYDPCCFNGYEYQLYSRFLSLETLKYQYARFNLFSDTLNRSHSISIRSLDLISHEIDTFSN